MPQYDGFEVTPEQHGQIRQLLARMPYGGSVHGVSHVADAQSLIDWLGGLKVVLERAAENSESDRATLRDLGSDLAAFRRLTGDHDYRA